MPRTARRPAADIGVARRSTWWVPDLHSWCEHPRTTPTTPRPALLRRVTRPGISPARGLTWGDRQTGDGSCSRDLQREETPLNVAPSLDLGAECGILSQEDRFNLVIFGSWWPFAHHVGRRRLENGFGWRTSEIVARCGQQRLPIVAFDLRVYRPHIIWHERCTPMDRETSPPTKREW